MSAVNPVPPPRPPRRPRALAPRRARAATLRGILLAALLGSALVLAACGSSAGSDEAELDDAGLPGDQGVAEVPAGAGVEADTAAERGAGPGGDADAGDGGADDPAAVEDTAGLGGVPAAPSGRRVVTASLVVETGDVSSAAADARDLAVRSGGFVANESTTGGEEPSARLRLRVPVAEADSLLADLAGLGTEIERETESEDVEALLVDLESRVATARASIERVRALLDEAEDLEDVILLESELADREADLEATEARRAALADLAELATVTVTFTGTEEPAVDDGLPGFLSGLAAGWRSFVVVTSAVLVGLGAALPYLAVLGIVGAGVWVVVRLRRARRRSRATS